MRLPSSLLLLCSLGLVLLGCDPIVMLPGGALSGDVKPLPRDWAFTDAVDTFQLETRPADPYSVNIWAIAIEDSMWVVAGGGLESTWAQHIRDDSRVRLRVGDAIYELEAVEANSESNRSLFLSAAKKKYDFEPDDEDTGKAVLFRLDPR